MLAGTIKLYTHYVRVAMRAQLQYRASLAMQTIGQLLVTGIEFVGLWAMFHRFGSLRGYTLAEVALFYGIVVVAFSLADAVSKGFDTFGPLVQAGDFDRILLRPRSAAFQLLAQEVTLRRFGRMSQGAAVMVWAMLHVEAHWTAAKVGLVMGCIVGGAAMFLGLIILQATMVFWTTQTLEIMNTLTYGGEQTAQYPLSIYHRPLRWFFTFVVPLAFVNWIPAMVILERPMPWGAPRWIAWCSPLAGVAFLGVCLKVWSMGVRKYSSTGS